MSIQQRAFFFLFFSIPMSSLSNSSPPLLPLKVLHAGLLERPLDVPVPARGEEGVAAVVRVQGDRGEVESLDYFGHRKTFLYIFLFPLWALLSPVALCAKASARGEASARSGELELERLLATRK